MAPTDPLIQKGAMLGIVGDLFRPFSAIINAGLTANPDTPATALSFRYCTSIQTNISCSCLHCSERHDLELFRWLSTSAPQILDDIRENGPDRLEQISSLVCVMPMCIRV